MARATAVRSSASSASVELTKTRRRWSGVRIAAVLRSSAPMCSSWEDRNSPLFTAPPTSTGST